ncbi:MAG: HAMP domain-containing protein [Gallionella sp.]|nr:HAMP domain-containing protein [Gallionella sp.]OIO09792.1 MAG: PAS domain-containing sensor histidine kinase [Gallionellaceae bacterium CG1_02_60_325]PIR09416.1 MAG: PAS domain-containing sensor histidine kinase [Gallionellaceae bacterium CG11_big_fil_rev_8_21_14_0_20_60_62]PIV48333.1 MAG: PAS domain-containing sensor histidine kinase [Gallionellaceae bacterium CG02_land_8_20_14_3_00_60_115]PJC04676.1 MAG: PAS domain-containing sensor histidine kinase [Gallionellaceae bacterium CG_4_9_14_0_
MKYLVLFSALAGVLLLYLLASASGNTELYSQNYAALLGLTGSLALGLLLLVLYQIGQLYGKLKRRVYGAKLTLRLAAFFSLIAVLPGLLVYAVSVQFLQKSIESWFDVRVEKALEGGLNLARSTLENGLDELEKKGRFVALVLAEQDPRRHAATLNRFIAEGLTQKAAVFDRKGNLLAHAGDARPAIGPLKESIDTAWQVGKFRRIDALPNEQLTLQVLLPIRSSRWQTPRLLQFTQPVSAQMASDAEVVRAVYGDYQQLSLSRLGLKRLFGITLTLSLLIVLLSALSAAFYFSARLSAPLAALASGTRAVAQGNFSGNYPVYGRDELGGLTVLFNQMTAQLASAKQLNEEQQQQVADAKAHLESVLAHLSSGVLVVDAQAVIRSANASAGRILEIGEEALNGQSLPTLAQAHPLLRPFIESVQQGIATASGSVWQRQMERMSKNGEQVLLLRCNILGAGGQFSHVLVFDDISHLLQAERQAAWGEVARRLAHEIKNPLTPIQLSAERLQHKLSAKLEQQDAQLLQRATATIVSQVAAMKSMVSDFADYARVPAAQLAPLDLHALLREVTGLYEANSSPVTLRLQASRARIEGDATRLRQVVHNLLQNAHDALQQTADPQIVLATEDAPHNMLCLSVTDNGSGFTEHFLAKAFDPYATTKPKGTGLGLPIVKRIVEEHGGSISIQSTQSGGARIAILLPLLQQKTEMSA